MELQHMIDFLFRDLTMLLERHASAGRHEAQSAPPDRLIGRPSSFSDIPKCMTFIVDTW